MRNGCLLNVSRGEIGMLVCKDHKQCAVWLGKALRTSRGFVDSSSLQSACLGLAAVAPLWPDAARHWLHGSMVPWPAPGPYIGQWSQWSPGHQLGDTGTQQIRGEWQGDVGSYFIWNKYKSADRSEKNANISDSPFSCHCPAEAEL